MRLLRPALAAALVLLAIAATPAAAKMIHFHGQAVEVPAGWQVIRLADDPGRCVRMDRRAVYLGRPSADQRCPSQAIGRRRAILVDPGAAARAQPGAAASAGLGTPTAEGEEFTGLGFDACAAPSSRTMDAWGSSPYRAIGVYIGGLNRGCSQPNLTLEWVSEQIANGWHLIPTYVGLQAPTSACGTCAELSTSQAAVQGAAEAEDAVADAQSIGIGPGNPIYFDMEAYTRTASATRATLTFLAAWTEELHALGYTSGVYSSSASGIADLAGQVGEDYPLPDDLWFANWNGGQNALDPYLPSTAWRSHQRIHQYRGGHNEVWGGVTINIDNNYVEGATVGAVAAARPQLPPLTVRRVRPAARTVRVWVQCGWGEGESCPVRIILRTQARLPLNAPRGVAQTETRIARVAVAARAFHLAGGKSHTYRVTLNSRGLSLLRRRGLLRAQMLVAIPGARAFRAVELSRR